MQGVASRGGAAPNTIPPAVVVLLRPTGYIFTVPSFSKLFVASHKYIIGFFICTVSDDVA